MSTGRYVSDLDRGDVLGPVEYSLSPMGSDLFEAIRGLEHWAVKWVMGSQSRKVTA